MPTLDGDGSKSKMGKFKKKKKIGSAIRLDKIYLVNNGNSAPNPYVPGVSFSFN
jgi:hypothetical protein